MDGQTAGEASKCPLCHQEYGLDIEKAALEAERETLTERVQGQSQRAEYAEGKVRELLLEKDKVEAEREALQRDRDSIVARIQSDDSLLRAYRCIQELKDEREALKGAKDEYLEVIEALTQETADLQAEVEALKRQVDGYVQWINNCTTLFDQRSPEQVQADLTRLRALVGALPKMEGEINEVTACLAVRGHRVTYAMIRDLLLYRATHEPAQAGGGEHVR